MTGRVAVIGSANVDLVVDVDRHPGPGETVLGGDLRRSPGGKGANQAVAAARAGGAATVFVGALGRDDAAELLLESLHGAGVATEAVGRVDVPTGTALITVTPDGENSIVVAAGANARLALTPAAAAAVAGADVVLAQLEVPLEVVLAAAAARRAACLLVLNAAPSRPLPDELWDAVDVLVVNEHEAIDLGPGGGDVDTAVEHLLATVPTVVVTMGALGALVARRGLPVVHVPSLDVDPVDSTGAGDTFCGVLAARLADGVEVVAAARAAVVAGALAVTRRGAQSGIPTAAEVLAALGRLA
ncbi:MAG: ribokinase [Cellulomonas sp. 73-92]|uniref:ribokinase n=1 Tax=Cellulomonas sp. 73-92 TaxID=1895740 RepID=UPI0009266A34|nr:ribokinase [Cellulomonas sp. 73-92]OJV82979.1 MAG: ribokinase [Cellulomonas sp. 73-92]